MVSYATTDEHGTLHVPAFDLPLSGFLSAESRAVLRRQAQESEAFAKIFPRRFTELADAQEAIAFRRAWDEHQHLTTIARLRARYAVNIELRKIAGVRTEIFTPNDGISHHNQRRVLINLHGGAFLVGGHWGGQLESAPIAALGKIKVVSIDYRMAPEHRFPAASEDVANVYAALLRDHAPESIGIYGTSAGGLLTAQSLAWLQKKSLPRPGAAGILAMGAFAVPSDSGRLGAALYGVEWPRADKVSYFTAADFSNPLAFPGLDVAIMAQFPPSLLITSTRDHLMSSVVATHTHLVKLAVKANLHVWEGLGHAFYVEPDLPESRDASEVIARFFDEALR